MIREVENDGSPVVDQFPVFSSDGFTKKSGLTLPGGDFVVTAWKDGQQTAVSLTITEISGTPGEYRVEWTPPFGIFGTYEIQILVNYNKEIWHGRYAVVGSSGDRILGLLHENAIVDNQAYDALDQLVSARVRVFSRSDYVPTAAGGNETLGLKYEYQVEAEYNGLNKLTKYILKRVL
jgi:hypothetical protein